MGTHLGNGRRRAIVLPGGGIDDPRGVVHDVRDGVAAVAATTTAAIDRVIGVQVVDQIRV